jgi:hypothetical protein
VLRHRAAWMATSVLRAQLRWLLDPPPHALSAQPAEPDCASHGQGCVSQSHGQGQSQGQGQGLGGPSRGVSRRCGLYKHVVLREAVPVPVYTPPPEVTEGLLAIGKKGGARGKQRRKSDVVLLRRGVDHTVVMPSEMPLSSLVAVALRQVYDGFAALAAGHGQEGGCARGWVAVGSCGGV